MNTQQIHNFVNSFRELVNKYKISDEYVRIDVSDPRETMFLKRQAYQMLDLHEMITTQHNDSVLLFFNSN
jgi:hypothetical protein